MTYPPSEWSEKAQQAYFDGLSRLRESMAEARSRAVLARWCNGADDCTATEHLACCSRRRTRA